MTLDDWLAGGTRVPVELSGIRREVWTRVEGDGPWCTLLHGFPTSSWDWHPIWADLLHGRRVLAFDLLGFGDSDKPQDHRYSIHEQADLTNALWQRFGVDATVLVAHDYGVSVAQELLARSAERRLAADIRRVLFMNGGLYPELHRAQPGQLLLLDPEKGPELSRYMSEAPFGPALRATYGRQPSDALIHDQWRTIERRDGHRIGHLLINYIRDRQEHAARWVGALETASLPRAFVWGMLDPVSGAHMAERIAARLPDALLVRLDDVGHWPQLEAPERVREVLGQWLR